MANSAKPQSTQPAPRGEVEQSDMSFSGVLFFLIGLAITLAILHFGVRFFVRSLQEQAQHTDRELMQRQPVPAVAASRAYFPVPREQIAPQLDLEAMRARDEAELNSYGWVDKKAGVVRIPIERAIELMSQRGATGTTGNKAGPSSLQLQQQRPMQSTPPSKEEGK